MYKRGNTNLLKAGQIAVNPTEGRGLRRAANEPKFHYVVDYSMIDRQGMSNRFDIIISQHVYSIVAPVIQRDSEIGQVYVAFEVAERTFVVGRELLTKRGNPSMS